MIKIFRENKLNYLNYIYRTNDNYILTSSNKSLIIDALQSRNINKKLDTKYITFKKLLNNFKDQHNILLTKNTKLNKLLNNENFTLTKEDYLVTFFNFKDKTIILKSFLINNNKSLNMMSYEKIDKANILDKE